MMLPSLASSEIVLEIEADAAVYACHAANVNFWIRIG